MKEIQEKYPKSPIFVGRLLKENLKENVKNTKEYFMQATDLVWNIEDETPAICNANIGTMRETTQMNKEKYRWIPNTGEYLELSDISILLKTKFYIDIIIDGVNTKLMFAGLQDRDCENNSNGNNGNIYKNKADNFTVRFFPQESKTKYEEKELVRSDKGLYTSEQLKEVKIGANGKLVEENDSLVIAVRPKNASTAYPGDDFYLNFKMMNAISNKEIKSFNSDVKDYIAVYDKKMLWRANLYIDEDGEDWNDVHPWNVPVSGNSGGPEWWNATDWGNNEWNRKYDLNKDSNVNDLTKLNNGDGKQVVSYTVWTPTRVKTSAGSDNNIYTDRVAYDYPYTKDSNGKYINAWDSPFDFLWKMNKQKRSYRKTFYCKS